MKAIYIYRHHGLK